MADVARKRPWSGDEVKKLLSAHGRLGYNWQDIALELHGRTAKMCRLKFTWLPTTTLQLAAAARCKAEADARCVLVSASGPPGLESVSAAFLVREARALALLGFLGFWLIGPLYDGVGRGVGRRSRSWAHPPHCIFLFFKK